MLHFTTQKFVGCNYFSNIAHNLMCREKLICAKSGRRTLCTLYMYIMVWHIIIDIVMGLV